MAKKVPISVAYGDGIGPEIMTAVLHILEAAGAQLEIEEIQLGEKVYLSGVETGIHPSAWESIHRTRTLLKAPMTTPQGGGYKSLNVTIRTTLGLYANIRPSISYHPYIATKHPGMNVVIVRENEEGLYTGIEYRQTLDTVHALKLMTRTGSAKIIRFAFEYARQYGRKKVTCFSKDNILKMTDGMFHQIFDEIAADYPDLEGEFWIVDIGAAKLADTPENFDVLVMPNLYGDILSDVTAQISGSVGLAGSANIGDHGAMFEAIHGSAPRRARQNLANPSGLLKGALLMLVHIGQGEVAETIFNAWLRTIEEGVHTYDIYKDGVSREKVGTKEFAQAVVDRLGETPKTLEPVSYPKQEVVAGPAIHYERPKEKKELVGVDISVEHRGSLEELLSKLPQLAGGLQLQRIYNRGAQIWPDGHPETFLSDQWRCRYINHGLGPDQLVLLFKTLYEAGVEFVRTEHLYTFDGVPGYSGA